jgi:hypothetical protein
MTRIDTPALDQLRRTNNLITVAAAADSDVVFGYILKRPPAGIDRLWYQALVLGPAEPFSGYLVAVCFEIVCGWATAASVQSAVANPADPEGDRCCRPPTISTEK